MIIVSDTNILSSLAAGDSFPALSRLYQRDRLVIPPSVQHELDIGFERGLNYLQPVLEAIQVRQIEVLSLSAEEEILTYKYPTNLNEGEREAIALAQTRKTVLLTNDGEALRYCMQRNMKAFSLSDLLRLLWVEQVMPQDEVRSLIAQMQKVEGLTLSLSQMHDIFCSRLNIRFDFD